MATRDLTLSELTAILPRHIETLRRLARQGRLPGAYRLGTRWMVRADAVPLLRGANNQPTKSQTKV